VWGVNMLTPAFTEGGCQACEDMPLGTLRSRASFFTKKPQLTQTASRSGPSTSGYEAAAMCVEGEQEEMNNVLPDTSPQTARPACSPVELSDDFDSSSQYGLDLLFEAPAEEQGVSAALEGGREPSEADASSELATPARLPSRVCKFSSALLTKAYMASGQAVSALYAMAILQVYQVKVLKDLHEGVPDPVLLQELRSETDYALRATKVTAQALGRAMSTMVVQERHLWLNLTEMRDAEKVRFLDAPISQAGVFGKTMEEFSQQFSTVKKQTETIKHILPALLRQQPPPAPRLRPQASPAARPAQRPSTGHKEPLSGFKAFKAIQQTATTSIKEQFPSSLGTIHSVSDPPCDGWTLFSPTRTYGRTPPVEFDQMIPPARGILCLVLTTQTRRAKRPVVFGAFYLQPQAVFPATVPPFQAPQDHLNRLCDSLRKTSAQVPWLRGENAAVLRVEIVRIETVPSAKMKKGFYSPYFIVPKKGGGLRPILDLRILNRVLLKLSFK
ncbi:hypothetical protein M9458_033228, partial [Cirrhinus mrigala]